jgi:hypothetical protein
MYDEGILEILGFVSLDSSMQIKFKEPKELV